MTTTISKNSNLLTFINLFTMPPAHQQEVADALKEVTAKIVSRRPGFVSASLHKSHDGTRVIMYAQWRSREEQEAAYEAMRGDPEGKAHLGKIMALASYQVGTFDVVETF